MYSIPGGTNTIHGGGPGPHSDVIDINEEYHFIVDHYKYSLIKYV